MNDDCSMKIEISEVPAAALAEYARIPIAFEVDRVLEVIEHADAPGVFTLVEHRIDVPCSKNYDAIIGEGPSQWAHRFDLSTWGFLLARTDGRLAGAAALVYNTAGIEMLEGRDDMAVLWDIRVAPDVRGSGVGTALFRAAEEWAVARGCSTLTVETQNVNVPACRFYERQGCVLGAIDRSAYPALPHEIRMLWYKELTGGAAADTDIQHQ